LANGIPKAGTHLLASVLDGLPQMRFSGHHHGLREYRCTEFRTWAYGNDDIDFPRLRKDLALVRDGQYLTAHFPYATGLEDLLETMGYHHILIIRDPRDIVVSDALYIASTPKHRNHQRFKDFRSVEDAMLAVIDGLEPTESDAGLESIGERLRNYVGWLGRPTVLVCRFEDIVGRNGQGSAERQRDAISDLALRVRRPVTEAQLDAICRQAWNPGSSTFQRGTAGRWRGMFTQAHVDAFDRVAGRELIEYGYERDDS
jgi:hypothetical protein